MVYSSPAPAKAPRAPLPLEETITKQIMAPRPSPPANLSKMPIRVKPQSTELTRGPSELVQHFGARALHVLNLTWFGNLSRLYPSGEEGGNILVQMIFTCFPTCRGMGGSSAPMVAFISVVNGVK